MIPNVIRARKHATARANGSETKDASRSIACPRTGKPSVMVAANVIRVWILATVASSLEVIHWYDGSTKS